MRLAHEGRATEEGCWEKVGINCLRVFVCIFDWRSGGHDDEDEENENDDDEDEDDDEDDEDDDVADDDDDEEPAIMNPT